MWLCVAEAGAQEWRALPGAPEGHQIQDIWFVDPTHGWTHVDGNLYRTDDGGATWDSIPTPGVTMRSITFTTPSRGFIGSLATSTPLWETRNGGDTWSQVVLPEPRPYGICGLWAVDENVIYGCGRYDSSQGPPRIIKTSDGGQSWTSNDVSDLMSGVVDALFFHADSGIVVGRSQNAARARILATTDGGKSWTIRYTGENEPAWCWKISFPTRRVGYVSVQPGGDYSGPLHCLRTSDGGMTWSEILISTDDTEGIGFATPMIGWVSGERIRRTNDGGATWTLDGFGRLLNRVRFLSPTLGYAAGRTIYKYSVATDVAPVTITDVKRLYGR